MPNVPEQRETAAERRQTMDHSRVGAALLESADHLRNGGKNDHELFIRSFAVMLESQKLQQDLLSELPKRTEVREMITTHATQCALARKETEETSGLLLGRAGLQATGKAAIWAVIALIVLIAVLGPYIPDIISAWRKDKPVATNIVENTR